MRRSVLLAGVVLPGLLPLAAMADAPAPAALPFVSPLFSDNMVLQRDRQDTVWGWTSPGTHVTATLAGKSSEAIAGADGRWSAKLRKLKAGGPYDLTVSGPQTVTFHNVMAGDVWICSGQSNMEFGIGNANDADREIATANYPNIRLLTIPHNAAPFPAKTANASWLVCTPENVKTGIWNGFSAVGYLFGRDIHRDTKVPIGLIQTAWGGTPAESWTPLAALQTMPDFQGGLNDLKKQIDIVQAGKFDPMKIRADWYAQYDPGSASAPGYADPALNTADWKTMALPTYWEPAGLPDFDGIVWFRREVTLTADQATRDAVLHLGPVDDMDTTWVNGVRVGAMDSYDANRDYKIPAGTLKVGVNVIAVRVLDTLNGGGLWGKPDQMSLELTGTSAIPLAGDWQYKATADYHKIPGLPATDPFTGWTNTALYNGMIAPLTDFGIKGAIWYQGESNSGRGPQYRVLLPKMIEAWRDAWHEGDFPFYIVGLAAFMERDPQPRGSDGWADIGLAQRNTAKELKDVAMSPGYDIGNTSDVHPMDKQDVGRRLALIALAHDYRRRAEYSGPDYKKMQKDGGKIRLFFDHVGSGLVAADLNKVAGQPETPAGKLAGFQIAGADKKWAWADTVIDGETVVVSSATVPDPVAVRYAYQSNPAANLFNKAGLPAHPFATDYPF